MAGLAERIDDILALDAAAPAFDFEGRWTDWGTLAAARRAVAAELAKAGLDVESRIGLLMRNHVAMVPAIYEVTGTRCLVTLNPMLNVDKLAADIASTQVPAVIGVASDLDREPIRHALAEAGCLVIEMTGDPSMPVSVRQSRTANNRAHARDAAPGIALEMLTSGTTGAPKRIPMRREAFEIAIFGAARFERGRSADDQPQLRRGVQLLMAPVSHISGLLALMNALVSGRSVALLDRFRVEDFRSAIFRHKIKVASIPPAALKMVFDADVPKEDLQSLQAFRVGTAPLDPDLADAVYDKYGIPILQNYGATEFGGVAGWTIDDFREFRDSRRGSVGRLNPGTSGRVVDAETGAELPFEQAGVLELKSPQIGDGQNWTRTTDLARLDKDGFLWIVGRADNAIIRGGFKVQPDEVVRALERHPAIVEACVVGLKDSRLGEVPGAAYMLAKDATAPTENDLVAFLKEKLTSYQVPVIFKPVAELPRTTSLKADQQAVKALLQGLHEQH
jgi:acyl-coenzyme A synthetase/AMP-(fatty) acid ligase